MGEFRIGRSRAQHSYPEPRFPSPPPQQFARNFAAGPATATDVSTPGTLVPWSFIESGAPVPSTSVPITPKSTGIVLIQGVLVIKNASVSEQFVLIEVLVDGVLLPVPEFEFASIDPNSGTIVVPILTEVIGLSTGTTHEVQVKVTPSANGAITLLMDSSSLNLQEVTPASG